MSKKSVLETLTFAELLWAHLPLVPMGVALFEA